MIHDFQESLSASHAADQLPIWEKCYRKFFPDFAAMVNHRQDGDHQRIGIDRSVILTNSKQFLVDEKVRFRNRITGKVYEDIALEEYGDEDKGTLGWAEKSLLADYIAYAIAPLGKCYLLPVPQLQMAWRIHKSAWKRTYSFPIRAHNKSWTTISWGIPVPVLFKAIGGCLRCEFEPVEQYDCTIG